MGKTAVGLYETSAEARKVRNELLQAGFDRSNIRIMLGDSSNRQLREWFEDDASRPSDSQWSGGNATSMLQSIGVPRADAKDYEEALHRGDALVSIETTDQRIDKAVDIMRRHNVLDINERREFWMAGAGMAAGSVAGADKGADKASTATGMRNRDLDRKVQSGEEATLPVIEEELRVGKRETERGGVRVSTTVTETPVEETVNLREEHVHVERRPVDRPVSEADLNKLHDQTIEVTESAEEAVISKDARVVEEVVVSKDVETRQEQIHDTVRRTDVNVEQLNDQNIRGWDTYRSDFQTHYQSHFGNRGHDFAYYEPAYRYGYTFASRPDYRGRSWSEIEPEIRRDWESRNQGPWEDFKDAIQHSWNRMTN